MAYLLIVDDENTTSDLLIAVLQKDGHTLHTAKNGARLWPPWASGPPT